MFNKLVFLLFILTAAACSSKTESAKVSNTNESAPTSTPNPDTTAASNTAFTGFADYVGKKPTEVQLFSKSDLLKRIEKLLGEDFADFKADWNNESAIMKDGEILYFVGCKATACAENKYFIMLDLTDNNINVIQIKNGRPRSFEEGAVIGMPEKLATDFEKIRQDKG
ncbi:MAG: hypothetical protein IPN86_09915 [Saprospiraceae bacterium]|nr:hypothetical protein [Saprospiraceae bacterium]